MATNDVRRLLFVDLDRGSVKEQDLDALVRRHFLGGLGLGVRVLYENMQARADPLGSDNWLGFVPGLLTGTPTPASARTGVVTKSPLTGTWCDSNVGGYLGYELAKAGCAGVFFTGRAARPVYLVIDDGKVELRDAQHLWGSDTAETQRVLREELRAPNCAVACIGPAGESLSLIASVVHDARRVAARGGMGAVMGSKRLKAVVFKGSGRVTVADRDRLAELRRGIAKASAENPLHKLLRTQGTCGSVSSAVKQGFPGLKNWQLVGETGMPAHAMIDGPAFNKYRVSKYACHSCPIGCGGELEMRSGQYPVGATARPEYESIAALGAMCLNDNADTIVTANDLCNRYGLDTISTGSAIAFAMECYERGLISKSAAGDVPLEWGNGHAVVNMVEKIARREGLGDLLADGVKVAAQRIGNDAAAFAVHVHGAELAMHDPRVFPGRGLMYMDANPGRHTVGAMPAAQDRGAQVGPYQILKTPSLERYGDYLAKGPTYALGAEYFLLASAAGVCLYEAMLNTYPLAEFIAAATGWDFTPLEGLAVGRRILTLRQCFNAREGVSPADIRLPARVTQPASSGPYAGVTVDFTSMLASYFGAMGWDFKSGWPYQVTLCELGLDEIAGHPAQSL
jgi:aldehyde:ferredoxin oxidoreductase